MMNVAIIPARGGSSRIRLKNIKKFAGRPIIEYSVEAARESGLFGRIIVSTDSDEIAKVAKQAGAEVPFMRPAELGKNEVNIADVVHHAVTWLMENGEDYTYTCCILATAPFLQADSIKAGYEIICNNDVDTVLSVVKFSFPVFRAFQKDKKGRMKFVRPEYELKHSNELPDTYHDAGQFYWLNTEKFLASKSIMGREVLPVELRECLVQDIDTEADWETAEVKYDVCKKRGLL
jgi:pseudaminic acid cytidylyltransferase